MAQEWVEMTHPDVGDAKGPVTREAYEQVWSKKGWKAKGQAAAPQTRIARNQPQPEEAK